MRQALPDHGRDHDREGTDPANWVYPFGFKVFADNRPTRVRPRAFVLELDDDLYDLQLFSSIAYLTTPASSDTEVMLHNETQSVEILLATLVIPSGALRGIGVPDLDHRAEAFDQIVVETITAGTGGLGLGMNLRFRPPPLDLTP